VGRSWEKAYAIVSRPHEETKRENPELAQQTMMGNDNQKQDGEEEGFRIQEVWEEYVEDAEEVEQSRMKITLRDLHCGKPQKQ
jgi:hypothetical protein